jgi:Ni,Fe-hydrogenase III large subunit
MHDFVFPMGPIHPGFKEPEYFKIRVKGEEIVDLDIYLGYNHKGVEKLIENRNWYQSIFAAERICGICGHVHTSSYCLGTEKLLGIEATPRANYIRALMAEMERIHNHLLWMGLAAYQIGFETLFMHCWGTRETVMDLVEIISGNRVHYGINTLGGVRRDVKKEDLPKIIAGLKTLKTESNEIRSIAFSDTIIEKRMHGVGLLHKNRAEELGAVGPVARGSEVHADIRNTGYFCYNDLDFKPVVHRGNDCHSRMRVRMDELLESIHMCERILDEMPTGEINASRRFMRVDYGEAIGRVEAPRGEVIHFVVSRGDVNPYRDKVRSPTYANMMTLKDMMVGQTIADAAIIIMSIDPCFSCTDRAMVVDDKTGKGKITNLDEIVPGHSHLHVEDHPFHHHHEGGHKNA